MLFSFVSQVCDYFIIGVFLLETSGGIIKKSYYYPQIQSHYTKHYQQENCLDLDSKAKLTITNIFSIFQVWKVYQLGKHPIPEMKHTMAKQN